MTFGSYLANAFKILVFDAKAVTDIKKDKKSFNYSLILLAILGVISGAWLALAWGFLVDAGAASGALAVAGFLVGIVAAFAGAFIGYGILHLFAKLFGGKADFTTYFAAAVALSFAIGVVNIGVMILSLIPLLGFLIALAYWVYSIILGIYLIREVHEISTGRAAAAYLIPAVILLIIFAVFVAATLFAMFTAGTPPPI